MKLTLTNIQRLKNIGKYIVIYLFQKKNMWNACGRALSKGIYYYKIGGLKGLLRKMEQNYMNLMQHKSDSVPAVKENVCIPPHFENVPLYLTVPTFSDIKVSIIIPVYNNFALTKQCVYSIIEHTKNVAYEIIVADDCSTDETKNISTYIKNILYSKTSQNMGFLLNCNHAAQHSRGEYILFLNNDTIVLDGWLNSLVSLMEQDTAIGLAGPKFLSAQGTLQEAGGIIFKDGSGYNYGRGGNPDNPEYNYQKEVDYISGACILLRKKIWNKMGGFDLRFTPCYYEDTDAAFYIRYVEGLKIVYEPQSVVYHLEGVSNGTDVTQGLKKYQELNRIKFYQKWKDVLFRFHAHDAFQLFLAKDYSYRKPIIVVIDFGILTFHEDTGSRSTYQYMHYFKDSGFTVKFFPHDFDKNGVLVFPLLNNIPE